MLGHPLNFDRVNLMYYVTSINELSVTEDGLTNKSSADISNDEK